MGCHIKTDHKARPIVSGYDPTARERKEFDWMEADELDCADFFRYRGQVYCLSEFPRSDAVYGFDAFAPDSYFSGIAIRLVDCENLIAALCFS